MYDIYTLNFPHRFGSRTLRSTGSGGGEGGTILQLFEDVYAFFGVPFVLEAIIVGVPSEIGEEDIKAYVIANRDVSPEELIEWCEGTIASFKLPRYVEFVDSFPRSDTKNDVQRRDLRDRGIADAWDREAR